MVSCLIFKSLSHFEFIFVCSVRACSNFIDFHATVQLSQHQLLKSLSFTYLIFLLPLLKVNWPWVSGFISGLYSVPLIHMSVFIPKPYCFHSCSFVILFEVWESYASCLVFVLQDCFGNSGSFMIPYKFLDYSSSVKNVMGNFIGIMLNLWITLGSTAILTILILPFQEHEISFYFFESFLISLINIL